MSAQEAYVAVVGRRWRLYLGIDLVATGTVRENSDVGETADALGIASHVASSALRQRICADLHTASPLWDARGRQGGLLLTMEPCQCRERGTPETHGTPCTFDVRTPPRILTG